MLEGTKIVTGEAMAKAVCLRLVERSCKFTMTPLPDDFWEFEVRADSVCVLDGVSVETDQQVLQAMFQKAGVPFGPTPYDEEDSGLLAVRNDVHGWDLDETGGSFSGFMAVFRFAPDGRLLRVFARE